jgi:hypothetical protein
VQSLSISRTAARRRRVRERAPGITRFVTEMPRRSAGPHAPAGERVVVRGS